MAICVLVLIVSSPIPRISRLDSRGVNIDLWTPERLPELFRRLLLPTY